MAPRWLERHEQSFITLATIIQASGVFGTLPIWVLSDTIFARINFKKWVQIGVTYINNGILIMKYSKQALVKSNFDGDNTVSILTGIAVKNYDFHFSQHKQLDWWWRLLFSKPLYISGIVLLAFSVEMSCHWMLNFNVEKLCNIMALWRIWSNPLYDESHQLDSRLFCCTQFLPAYPFWWVSFLQNWNSDFFLQSVRSA